MAPFKLLAFLSACLAFLPPALLSRLVLGHAFPRLHLLILGRMGAALAGLLLRIFDIEVERVGNPPDFQESGAGTNYLLVSNHLGYLDIPIINSVFPVRFVARQDLRTWPVIGQMAVAYGCLFCNRNIRSQSLSMVRVMTDSLRVGHNLAFFPEGTSTAGGVPEPFKPMFFEAAVLAQRPVRLEFLSVDGRELDPVTRDGLHWYGEMAFAPHFWNMLRLRRIRVRLTVLAPIYPPDPQSGRREKRLHLSNAAYEVIAGDSHRNRW